MSRQKRYKNLLYLKAFGKAVKTRRNELNISQEMFGFECGLDRTYISGIERGLRNPSLDNIVVIAKALKINPSELFALTEKLMKMK